MKRNHIGYLLIGLLILSIILMSFSNRKRFTPSELEYRGHIYLYYSNNVIHAGHCKGIHKVSIN